MLAVPVMQELDAELADLAAMEATARGHRFFPTTFLGSPHVDIHTLVFFGMHPAHKQNELACKTCLQLLDSKVPTQPQSVAKQPLYSDIAAMCG